LAEGYVELPVYYKPKSPFLVMIYHKYYRPLKVRVLEFSFRNEEVTREPAGRVMIFLTILCVQFFSWHSTEVEYNVDADAAR
jgi:hypothetical protein